MHALRRLAVAAIACTVACRGSDAGRAVDAPVGRSAEMPSLERRSLALAPDDMAEQHYWPMGISESGQIVYLASAIERPMFRIVDSTGARLHAFGRQGDGPGEFRSPIEIQVRRDTVRIFDAQRMTLFQYGWDGRLIREARAPFFDIPLAWVGDSVDHWNPPGMTTNGSPVIRRTLVGDTAGRVLIAADDSAFQTVLNSAPDTTRLTRLSYAIAPNRIYLGDAYRYRIFSYDGAGHLLATFGRQLPPHHRGPRELATQRESILREPKYTRGPNGEAVRLPDRSGRLDTLDREVTPYFNRAPLHVDDFGRLWVVGVTNDSTTVDVFADSTFRGRIVLPCYLVRNGSPVALTGHWLLLECALPDASDHASELQLYRIVEHQSAIVSH